MPIELKDVWDFHTDLRWMVDLPDERAYLAEQIDIPTAAKLGVCSLPWKGWEARRRRRNSS